MPKILVVGWREFRQRVRSRGFLIGALATPLILMVIWAFTGFSGGQSQPPLAELNQAERPDRVIGYVDQANLIRSIPEPVPADLFRAFPDVEAAQAALDAGTIGAYYVIPADYRQTGGVRRVSLDLPTMPPDQQWFDWILIGNLLPEDSPQQIARLRQPLGPSGPNTVLVTAEGQTGARGNTPMPFLITIAVLIPLFTSGGYLLQSLTQEKSSRIMEILLVSLRPSQLLTGKLLGLGLLTLVQYLIWGAIALLALVFTGSDPARLLAGINLSTGELLLVMLYALGGFVLYAALMAGIGALASDLQNSRTWVFVITLPMLIPMYLWAAIANAPNSALATILSLFPFSAPVAMMMRLVSTTVPGWQLAAGLPLLLLTGIGVVWLMARLFRAQTLLSGEPLSARRMWAALRSASS